MAHFDTIVLLTDHNVAQPLSHTLLRHRPKLELILVETRFELETIPTNILSRARLIGFVTGTIVSKQILDALGYGAYNFHPGPPEYPGWSPARFAIYERACWFGATAHRMAEQVDSGPIVNYTRFPIIGSIALAELEALAFIHSVQLFWELAPSLASEIEPIRPQPIAWGACKCTRKRYAELCATDVIRNETARQRPISLNLSTAPELMGTVAAPKFTLTPSCIGVH